MRPALLVLLPLVLLACDGESHRAKVHAYLAEQLGRGESSSFPSPHGPEDPELVELTLLEISGVEESLSRVRFKARVLVENHSLSHLRINGYRTDGVRVHVMAESESGRWHSVGMGICGTGIDEHQFTAGAVMEREAVAFIYLEDPKYILSWDKRSMDTIVRSPGTGRAKVVLSYQACSGGPWFEAATETFDIPSL